MRVPVREPNVRDPERDKEGLLYRPLQFYKRFVLLLCLFVADVRDRKVVFPSFKALNPPICFYIPFIF